MPFIHIQSLPLRGEPVYPVMVREISATFSEELGIDERHVTVTWTHFRPGHYCFGGTTGDWFDPGAHQIMVRLVVPDYNEPEDVQTMLSCAVSCVSAAARIPLASVFGRATLARSGQVFDEGEIVEW